MKAIMAITDGQSRTISNHPPDEQDRKDAEALYHILENKVIPLYYERDINGTPRAWLQMVKESIRSIAPYFSARRMVKAYTEMLYLTANLQQKPEEK